MARDLQTNLIYAEAAVKYADEILRGRSSNRPDDLVFGLQKQLGSKAVADMAKNDKLLFQTTMENADKDTKQKIVEWEVAARSRYDVKALLVHRVGNCWGHSLLAAYYLQSKRIPSFIAETQGEEVDHVFVLIGLEPSKKSLEIRVPTKTVPTDFPPEAVVCDPWYHEWFSVQSEWPRKMGSIFRRNLVDPSESVPQMMGLKLNPDTFIDK